MQQRQQLKVRSKLCLRHMYPVRFSADDSHPVGNRVCVETVAAAGNASFLLTSVIPSPSSSSASATPKAVRTLKPIRRRPSPSRYAFHDSLDVSHAPSKGSWSTPKRLEDGFKYIKEGGHQRKSPGDSLLETGSLSSSFSYQRATTAHGISRSASCPPIVARG